MRIQKFDLCILDSLTIPFAPLLAYLCGIPERIGFPHSPREEKFLTKRIAFPSDITSPDVFDFTVAYARAVGVTDELKPQDILPCFPFQPETLPNQIAPKPIVAVHAGGAKLWNRRWPLERYQQICLKLCQELEASVYLLGGAEEKAENDKLVMYVHTVYPTARIYNLSDSSLNQTANYLKAADLFIGNDSGPMHIAATIGKPVIVIYGPSNSFFWERVYTKHTVISQKYECQKFSPFAQQRHYERKFSCSEYLCPYTYDPEHPIYPNCLTTITIDKVWDAIQEHFRSLAPKENLEFERLG